MKRTFATTNCEMNLILDFHVRWNSIYFMLKRLQRFKLIVNDILNNPDNISGLTAKKKSALSSLSFTYSDWEIVDALIHVLARFFEATKMLSGRKYPTLSLAFVVHKMLHTFLTTDPMNTDSIPVSQLKAAILPIFNYHLNDKISKEQKEVTLVKFKFTYIFQI